MFYMESGTGASNLNIRFNLSVIPPASFAIEKELPENVQADYTDRRFAFKVYVQEEYNSSNYVQIDPDMWDRVDINHVPTTMVIDGTGTVSSDSQSVSQRARVVFDNVPKHVQKLLINKVVESLDPESVDPNLVYEFYVYLEGHSGNLEPYKVGEYYLTKTIDGTKHYYNNAYTDLGTEPQICSYSGEYGTIGNIRAGYTIEIPGLLPGTDFYVVERENRIPDGFVFVRKDLTDGTYDTADTDIYFDGNTPPDGKIKAEADAEVTVVNSDVTIHLIKVDATDMTTPLERAQFTLKKLDPEGYGTYPADPDKVEKVSEYTGEDGKTYIGGIKNGYYEISETAVPAGYVLIDDGKFYIKVQNGNITLLAKDTNKKVKDWPERTLTDQDKLQFDNKTNTFTVGNPPGVALPSAGGSGTILIYLLGGLLCASAAIALVVRRHMLKI